MASDGGLLDGLPADLAARLRVSGIDQFGEVALREALELRALTYTLYRLSPAAARKWKARYRIMLGATYFDAQSVPEAYGLALASLSALELHTDVVDVDSG